MFPPPSRPFPARPPRPRAARGSVLVVVLVVCLGLVSLVLVFSHSMLMAYRGADNALAGRQAELAIEGAARYALALMSNVNNPGDFPAPSTYQSAAVPVGDARFWFIGQPSPSDPIDKPVFRLADEAGKLNLNRASVTMLENLPAMTSDLATAITTWRSTAGTVGGLTSLSTSPVKQGPFESVEELAQVNGGTDLSLLYGLDANLNHVIDPEEGSANATSLSAAGIGTPTLGLLEYCTAFTREPNTAPDGTQKVNVTNLAGGALPALLDKVLGNGVGGQIMSRLRSQRATVNNVLDFYYKANLTADQLDQLTPYLTISNGTYQVGMINVNTANPTVLSCVPGISYDLATQIVSARQQLQGTGTGTGTQAGSSVSSTPSTGWTNLAAVGAILGQTNASQAGRYLTTRSYQWCADVAAVGRFGRGYRRVQMILDNSTGTPQIVYRRDLSNLGWALGADERQALAQQLPGGSGGIARP